MFKCYVSKSELFQNHLEHLEHEKVQRWVIALISLSSASTSGFLISILITSISASIMDGILIQASVSTSCTCFNSSTSTSAVIITNCSVNSICVLVDLDFYNFNCNFKLLF
jgi:hypothetical protein